MRWETSSLPECFGAVAVIRYRTKNWFEVLFNFHKSPLLRRILRWVLLVGIYTTLVTWATKAGWIGKLPFRPELFPLMTVLLTLLLAFRTNTAYDRWWEGRKILEYLVNNTRNLAIFLDSTLDVEDLESRQAFAADLTAYASAVGGHLGKGVTYEELLDLDLETIQEMKKFEHIPNALASRISRRIYELSKRNIITGYELINLKRQIGALTDIIGAGERIKTTPIPFSYNTYVKHLVFWFSMVLPFGLQGEYGWFSIPIVMICFGALLGLELLATDIEDPFGSDENDLPTEELTRMIRRNVYELLVREIPRGEVVPTRETPEFEVAH